VISTSGSTSGYDVEPVGIGRMCPDQSLANALTRNSFLFPRNSEEVGRSCHSLRQIGPLLQGGDHATRSCRGTPAANTVKSRRNKYRGDALSHLRSHADRQVFFICGWHFGARLR